MTTNDQITRKRITVKPKSCPNPLFVKWLEEWRDEAAERNSDLKYCYDKALQSLRKYPLELQSGKQCLILKNFGQGLCTKLDTKLAEYQKNDAITNDQISSKPASNNEPKKNSKRKKENIQGPKSSDNLTPSPKKKKSYVPGWRSGPYAILVTLYKEQLKPDYRGFLRKVEIQEKAQDLCDSSFLKPEPGSHYTAWSSMSVIVKKGFVSRQGNPAKFSLTKEGEELAKKLYNDLNTNHSSPSSVTNASCSRTIFPKGDFEVNISDEEQDILYDKKKLEKQNSIKSPKKIYPMLLSESENESDTKITTKKSPKKFKSPRKNIYPINVSESEDESSNILRSSPLQSNMECIDLTDDNIEDTAYNSKPRQENLDWLNELNKNSNIKGQNDNFSQPSTSSVFSTASEFEQFIFLPGEFEVILLVDTAEMTGKARNALCDDPVKELTKLGTKFEVRHLKVGDFVWISRHKDGKELVLPYIVERKRMDDLGGSIKDGRFHEQKFRLRQCGIENVIYLVEKYGNESRLGLPISTLHQAAVNTQICDQFYVKYTGNFHQSMTYLSVMSNSLSAIFKDKTLVSCAKCNLPEFNIKDDIASLITFEEFTKISVKNKVLKVRDMFIKQLLQLKGLSLDKALAITERYSSPRKLIAAFKESSKPELLLANIPAGPLNRNIGPMISKTIYQLYCSRNFV